MTTCGRPRPITRRSSDVYDVAGIGHDFDATVIQRDADGKGHVVKKYEESAATNMNDQINAALRAESRYVSDETKIDRTVLDRQTAAPGAT